MDLKVAKLFCANLINRRKMDKVFTPPARPGFRRGGLIFSISNPQRPR
jgi:hypothetical protein